jgi:hypothetical protein
LAPFSQQSPTLIGREPPLTISLCGFDLEFVCELACDSERFLVRGDAAHVRRKIEARNLVRDGDRCGSVSVIENPGAFSVQG